MNLESPVDHELVQQQTPLAHAEWHEQLASTNDELLRRDAQVIVDLPCLVGAEVQSSGRGRGSNRWETGRGALLFSVMMRPSDYGVPSEHWPALSIAVASAICEAVESLASNIRCHIKWPNDVFANDRKLAGILIEAAPQMPGCLVVGIGMNVNNDLGLLPDNVRNMATSLEELSGQPLDRTDVLVRLLQSLFDVINRLGENDSRLVDEWNRRNLVAGEPVTVTNGDTSVHGTCLGIDADGALRLSTESGPERFISGTLRRLTTE